MGNGYSKKETLEELLSILNKDSKNLYNSGIVNRKGLTNDTKELYTEIIIEDLFDKNKIIDKKIIGIDRNKREKSYYTKSHKELVKKRNAGSNRAEENYVKDLFINNPFEAKIGKPIEFQVPLKNKSQIKDENNNIIDKEHFGKIDLITYKSDSNELFLVEVKANNSNETALRAILEIQTYFQVIDQDKLIKNLAEITNNEKRISKETIEIKENPNVKKALIIFENTKPSNEIKENRKQLQKLINTFEIKVCYAK